MRTPLARICVLVGLAVAVLFGLLSVSEAAPVPANDPKVLISDKPNDVSRPLETLVLRPNQTQGFYLFVHNPSADDMMITMKVSAAGKELPAVTQMVRAGEKKPFLFKDKPKDPKAPANAAKADEGAMLLEGKPLRLRVALFDQQNNPLGGNPQEFAIELMRPSQYVEVASTSFYGRNNRIENQLTFDLKAKADQFSGPPCPVDLVLSPQYIPGLKPEFKDVNLGDKLENLSSDATLYAKNLVFENREKRENGLVFIDVDDYKRAFVYKTTFARNSNPTPEVVNGRRLAIERKRYFNPKKNKEYVITAQVDNIPLDAEVTVELGLGLSDKGKFGKGSVVKVGQGPRKQQVWLLPGSGDGALPFKTAVTDWSHSWDVSKILGDRKLRARLLDKSDKPLLGADDKPLEVEDDVTFLDTSPSGIKLEERKGVFVQKGAEPLEVRATTTDPRDLIKEVYFFVGKPVEDKAGLAAPREKVRGELVEDESKGVWWTARLPLLPGAKGPVEVSVQFVNQVDLSSFDTQAVQVVAPAAATATTTGTIAGTVKEADRLQPEVAVVLRDSKGKEIDKGRTNDQGEFEFKKVPPGDYKVSARKTNPLLRTGTADVKVSAGETSKVAIGLEM